MSLTGKGYVKVGSTEYKPQKMKISFDSLVKEDSGRTLNGNMEIGWIKPKYVKLEITMPPMDSDDGQNLIGVVQGQNNLSVEYWDPSTKGYETKTMYCSNCSCDWYSGALDILQDISFSLIEI